jgi:universal stress protein A
MESIKLPRRILVPVDFSEGSRAALHYALALAQKLDGEIELLHVWEVPSFASSEMLLTQPSGPPMSLGAFAGRSAEEELKAWSPNVSRVPLKRCVIAGPTVASIIERAAAFDLVVMGTHGRTGISHLLLGSVAERVVRRSPCPVLTVRRTEKAA